MPKNLEIFAAFYTRRLNIVYHVCLAKTERKFNLRGRTNEKLGETNEYNLTQTQITLYGFSFRFVIPLRTLYRERARSSKLCSG